MLKADLHIHSEGSYDGTASVEAILGRAKDKDLDVVGITDHDTIKESIRASELAPEYGMVAIPSIEVSTSDGHLLAWGIEEKPEPGNPIEETIEEVRSMGGLATVPHPFQKARHGAGPVKDCDAIEVFNSRLITGRSNRQAKKFAQKHDLVGVAGSDAHSVRMVGRAYMEIEVVEDSPAEEILEAVKKGNLRIHGKRTPIHLTMRQFAKSAGRRAAKMFKYRVGSYF